MESSLLLARKITQAASAKYPKDIEKALRVSREKVSKHPKSKDLTEALVMEGLRSLIHDARHEVNNLIRDKALPQKVETKKPRGYQGVAKVRALTPEVIKVSNSVYNFAIAGKTLGMLTGADLPALLESEVSQRDSHNFHVKLLESLVPILPQDKRVDETLSERKLRVLIKQAENKSKSLAA